MADLAKYVVSLEAETRKYRRELDRANRKLGKFTKTQERQINQISAGFKRLGVAAAGFISLETVRRIVRMADSFNRLSVRVRTATRLTGDFVEVQKGLLESAIETGASFESQIDAFQGISRIKDSLGATNQQVVAFTRLFSQLGVIGGSSAKQISDSIRQLVQGLAQGTIRMEEFNSISDNTPEVLAAMARGLGISLDQLILMAKQGRLLAREVFPALLNQSAEIAERFGDIPANLERAGNALTTSLGAALSKLDESVGFTRGLAEAIEDLAEELAILSGSASEVAIIREQIEDLEDQFRRLAQSGNKHLRDSNRELYDAWGADMNAINQRILDLRASLKGLREEQEKAVAAAIPKEFETSVLKGAAATRFQLQGPEAPNAPRGRFATPGFGLQEPPPAPPKLNLEGTERFQQTTRENVQEMNDLIFGVFDEAEDRLQNFSTLFVDNMVQAADGGFNSILQSWARTLEQMAAKALASQLFKLLGFGNADGGFLGLGKLFSAEGRASGGPVSNGTPFLVGEKGPELFIPGASGRIVPNGEMGGNVFHIDARGAVPGMELRIREAVQEAVAISDSNRIEARRRGR